LSEEFKDVRVDERNSILVPHFGSTEVGVRVCERGQHIRIDVDAPILFEVKITPALLDYLAWNAGDYDFGYVYASRLAGMATLTFRYSLLGDAVNKIELIMACVIVGHAADELDDILQPRLGGNRWAD